MDVFSFAITIILVTGSGALAPGPLFFENLTQGARFGAKSGLLFSFAHNIVELTLVMSLALGLLTFAHNPTVQRAIGIIGGVVLVAFGAAQISGFFRRKPREPERARTASNKLFFMGLALTGLNPFFVVWWLTAGAQLIMISLEFASFAGVALMYVCHVWMDYAWLTGTAHLAKVGLSFMGQRWYGILIATFGAFLIFFGFNFILTAVS
jgi:threonine/homoserine/homoserine lactone efflux protein